MLNDLRKKDGRILYLFCKLYRLGILLNSTKRKILSIFRSSTFFTFFQSIELFVNPKGKNYFITTVNTCYVLCNSTFIEFSEFHELTNQDALNWQFLVQQIKESLLVHRILNSIPTSSSSVLTRTTLYRNGKVPSE